MKIWRCSYVGHFASGAEFVNDLYYQTDLDVLEEEPSAANVGDAVNDHLKTAYKACIPASSLVNSLEVREEVDPLDPSLVPEAASIIINEAGTLSVADQNLPDAATLIVTKRTDAATRSGRGYIAMPSPKGVAQLTTSNRWNTGGLYFGAVTTFSALLDDDVETGGVGSVTCHPVVYSRTRAKNALTPVTFRITSALPRPEVRWRRTRTTAP